MRADRRGVVLLEALVAMVLLGAAAASLTALALESGRATDRARRADRETRAASAFLDVVALWPSEDLERRLGSRHQGDWMLDVRRTAPALYRVSLRDSTGRRELLQTTFYRPDTADTGASGAHR
jgi:type II secretory pathway pseudopilin PulG